MQTFIETAVLRETDFELMQAIDQVSVSEEDANRLWLDGPNSAEMVAISAIVTKNGTHKTTDFCWGPRLGNNWAQVSSMAANRRRLKKLEAAEALEAAEVVDE